MKRKTPLLLFVFVVLFENMEVSEGVYFQKGVIENKGKDFATAGREWKPFAKQGNAAAQYFLGNMYLDLFYFLGAPDSA